MPLQIPVVAENQRTEILDFNRQAALGIDNLARALGGALLPQAGALVRGGKVKQTGPASKNVIVEPLCGIDVSRQLLLLEDEVTLAVPNNTSGNPRIDLVSVGYVPTDLAAENRYFWNPATEVAFQQNTVAQRQLKAVPVLTVGTPAGSPVAPSLPAGHIALAQVSVVNGFVSIVDADITRLSVSGPLQAVTWAGAGGMPLLPYDVPESLLRVSTPAGGLTLLYAQVHVESGSGVAIENSIPHRPLIMAIEEVGVGVVARSSHRVAIGGEATVVVAGVVVGPRTPAATYQVTFDTVGTDGAAWGVFTSLFNCPAEHSAGVATKNLFVAVTL